jgi:hypothetical protein
MIRRSTYPTVLYWPLSCLVRLYYFVQLYSGHHVGHSLTKGQIRALVFDRHPKLGSTIAAATTRPQSGSASTGTMLSWGVPRFLVPPATAGAAPRGT